MTVTPPPHAQLDVLQRRNAKLQRLLEVAKSLGAERDVDSLLESILKQAAEIIDADRCTLFIVDREKDQLWSKIAQGMVKEGTSGGIIRIALGNGIAGSCAKTGEVINLPDPYADARFNRDIDRATGYRTASILAVPMLALDGHVTGVIQALNKQDVSGGFTAEDEELLLAVGSTAAVAIENAFLHRDIQQLFDGFVRASVYAIEARDPSTSGHSERVAVLTVAVAEAVNKAPPPEHRHVRFSSAELRELRYAALLHDFGKVGVSEQVLMKANKLYPHELALMKERFEHARARSDVHFLERKVEALAQQGLHGAACGRCAALDAERAGAQAELDEMWTFIEQANMPTVLAQGGFERLNAWQDKRFTDRSGAAIPLLTDHERVNLSIRRGSLNAQERLEIESHVTHTYEFLRQIPWTHDLQRLPEIAAKHHEKLTGRGYPGKVPASDIPVQTRIMTIADIYDALTAADRPYKKALPHEQAIDILLDEANDGFIDRSLLTVFIESKAHKSLLAS